MQFYQVEPDVAGGLGEHTVLDPGTHPPRIDRLHYEFEDWSGDALVTSFPCFLVTRQGKEKLEFLGATGVVFDDVEVSTSDIFKELKPGFELPEFLWMKIVGEAGRDDFGIGPDFYLIVSERALNALREIGLREAIVSACGAGEAGPADP